MHTGTLFSFPVTWLHKHGQVGVYLGTLMSYEQETMDKSKKVEDYWIPARIRQDLFLFYYFRIRRLSCNRLACAKRDHSFSGLRELAYCRDVFLQVTWQKRASR